ncbi:MAG: IS5/IS1182 family transposase, partial [Planctomycetes bacterium]|nr:IS5/IS1182 family transposase [Planctomycetota bacterium]
MRGAVDHQGDFFHTFHFDDMIPAAHPLRSVKVRADRVLGKMSRRFNQAYGTTGRPSVPPERL